MTIDKYEVAENAYSTTPGKFHVRGVSDGMTQFEEQAVAGFHTRAEADEYCQYMNDRLGWPARLAEEHAGDTKYEYVTDKHGYMVHRRIEQA